MEKPWALDALSARRALSPTCSAQEISTRRVKATNDRDEECVNFSAIGHVRYQRRCLTPHSKSEFR